MKWAYYNEIDPKKCAWIRELIKVNAITDGEVDERSIQLVQPDDLKGFRRCHFFAGIGIWDYALNQAGWPDDREVWTGSCPCQPFSAAGKGEAFNDERHLWPEFFRLIEARRPVVCFGEQVASIDGLAWLDLVQADLDDAEYTCGAVDLCAAGFGAPHRRQRLYWVADAEHAVRWPEYGVEQQAHGRNGFGRRSAVGRRGNAGSEGLEIRRSLPGDAGQECATIERTGNSGGLADNPSNGCREECTDNGRRGPRDGAQGRSAGSDAGSIAGGLADNCGDGSQGSESRESDSGWTPENPGRRRSSDESIAGGLEDSLRTERGPDQRESGGHREASGRDESTDRPRERSEVERVADAESGAGRLSILERGSRQAISEPVGRGPVNGFWGSADWVLTRPQRVGDRPGLRPVERGAFPLAHGSAARVGRLRGYGDGIVAQVAEAFVRAYMQECP